jgi:hypothetical protein
VVFLGIFTCVQRHRESIHWRLASVTFRHISKSGYLYVSCRLFWVKRSSRETLYRECPSPIHRFLCLPADVRCDHVCAS